MPSLQKMFSLLGLTDVVLIFNCTVHGFENVRYSVREREEMEDGMEEEEGQDRVDTTFKFNVKGTTIFGGISLLGDITTEAGPNTGQFLLHVQLKYFVKYRPLILPIFDCV